MLMDPDTGGIDHHDVAIVALRYLGQKAIPVPGLAPPHKAIVAGAMRAVALRNVGPGRARSEAPEDAVQHLPVIDPPNAARLARQKRLDNRSFEIRQFVAAQAHHNPIALGRHFMSSRPNRFWLWYVTLPHRYLGRMPGTAAPTSGKMHDRDRDCHYDQPHKHDTAFRLVFDCLAKLVTAPGAQGR